MKMISRQNNVTFFLCLLLSVLCISCAAMKKDQPAEPIDIPPDSPPDAVYERGDKAVPSGYYVHTVKLSGESLSIIAKWFTGDLKNWQTLAEFNPKINPNRIFFGDKIRIPRHLMIRHDRMTQKFVDESQPKPKEVKEPEPEKTAEEQPAVTPPEVPPAAEPPAEEEPFLFGPKDYSK